MTAGMASVCPLTKVTLFVVQLTKRDNNFNPTTPSIYLPLSFDVSQNSLFVYIPPRSEANLASSLPYLLGIDAQLKQFCEQFRASGSPGCVIYAAIRRLLTNPNLLR